jgi:hypothetical protein
MTQLELPRIRRKVLGDLLVEHLRALPGPPTVTIYRGEVPDHPPKLKTAAGDDDASGRVAPYAVVFDGTGPTDLEPALQRCGEDLRWTPQVTVAAGVPTDCIQAVDRVYAWVCYWSPSIPGVAAGEMEPPPGYDPGPPRPDRTLPSEWPPRFFVPLQWQLDLTT